MKIWGSIIVAFAVLVGTVAVLIPTSKNTVSATSVPPSSNAVKIHYKDGYKVSRQIVNDTTKFTDYQPLKFKENTSDTDYQYDGFGAIVGTMADFELQLVGTTQEKHLFPTPDDRADNWVYVDFLEPLPSSTTGTVDYKQLFATKTFTHIIPSVTEVVGNEAERRSGFKFIYDKQGIYRVQVYTRQGTDGAIGLNTFIIIARVIDVNFGPQFFAEANSGTISMTQAKVTASWMDQQTRNGEKPFAILTFANLPGYSNVRIVRNTYTGEYANITRLGQSESVSQIAFSNPIYDNSADLKRDIIKLFFVKNKSVPHDKYIINFTIEYDVPLRINAQGIHSPLVDEDTGFEIIETKATFDVIAEIEFVSAPPGYQFPWKTLLICVGVMLSLGAGLFACNWFMKYSNAQNTERLKKIRETREEVERQNLEKLRERVRLQELMEEQESAQNKKPVRKLSVKKPNQDTE